MSTVKAIGGTLTHFGKKLALGITSSEANVEGPDVEVNVPPIWEEANNTTGNVGNFQTSLFDGDFLVYRPFRVGINGDYSANEADVGSTFKLSERTFLSASDRNTGAELTLTLISQSIVSGSSGTHNTQEISINDINVIFPDNASPGGTASFFIETSSNFLIHEDITYKFEIQVKDQHDYISRVNKPSDSNHNSQHNIFNQLSITNTKESPFIITQSNNVSISSSTTPSNNISEMEFSLGNESSPDFSLIPTIFIKDRDRMDITDIKSGGENTLALILYNGGFDAFITTHSIGGDNLIFSSSNLVANNESASARYFQLDLSQSLLPNKLSAKNSPYKLEISASDGTSIKTSSSIILNITNENPVWSASTTVATASLQNIDTDSKRSLIVKTYASASDPGDDNITLSQIGTIQVASGDSTTGTKGLNSNFFTTEFINNNSITSSFRIVTSSNFPLNFNTTASKGNEQIFATVRASDECSPAGTTATAGDTVGVLVIDAPPSWSAVTQTITGNENDIGSTLSSNTYKTVFDDTTHIGTVNAGSVRITTGSDFQIQCIDPRLSSDHFIFTPTNATNGNNATFSIQTSSLYDRIDANAGVQIAVTASDNLDQESYHIFQVNINNVDEFIDVLGSDLLGDLRTFFSRRIDGVTTQLANTVTDISSPLNGTELLIVSGTQTSATISQSVSFITNTVTSANGNTVDFDVISTGDSVTRVPVYPLNTLKSTGAGSFILWSKTGARSSLNTENDTIFGQALSGLNENTFNFSSEAVSSINAELNVGNVSISVPRYFNTFAEGSTLSGRDFHQLAVTWDGTNIGDEFKLYYNSTLVGSASLNANAANGVGRGAYLGALGSSTETPSQIQPISMSIFASFNKQLSTSEVTTIFNAFSGSHGL